MSAGPGAGPRLSVVIPSYNRRAALERCLGALADQTADPDAFEVVVVLDGSTDGSQDLLAGLRPPHRLRFETKANGGVASARNRGIALAQAPVVLFIDDDIVAAPGLVAAHLRAHEQPAVMVMGALELRLQTRPDVVTRRFVTWWEGHYARLASGERRLDATACYSGNLSLPTAAARAIGGFDETLRRSEDVDFGHRAIDHGLRFVFAADATAVQDFDKDGGGLVRDWDGAGRSALELLRRYPDMAGSLLLGGYEEGGRKARAARAALLLARPSPALLARLAVRLPRRTPGGVFGLLQSYLLWRGVRATATRAEWRRLTRGTVILMYHALGAPREPPSRYVLPARRFARQLAWLRLTRRPVLALDEYVRLRGADAVPPRAVVVTFDDGYADNGTLAAPALRARRIPATLFVVSDRVGDTNAWTDEGPLAGRPLLDAAGLAAVQPPFTVGAHTRTHRRLTGLPLEQARAEIGEPRAGVRHFAYPYGSRDATVRGLVEAAGFASASGIRPGPNSVATDLFDLRRLEVVGTAPLWRFALESRSGRPLVPPKGA